MEILKFSYEEIEKLKHKRDLKQAEFDTLSSKQPTDLWKEDIDEFYKCYEKDYKEYLKEHCGEITIKKKKRIRKKKISK